MPSRLLTPRLTFTPRGLPGLVRFGEALSLAGLVEDDAISTYEDLSGNGYNYTSAGGARPTFKAGVFNGYPGMLFTAASSQLLSNDDIATLFTGVDKPFTCYTVVRFNDVATLYSVWGIGRTASNTPRTRIAINSGVFTCLRRDDSNASVTANTTFFPEANRAYVVAMSFDGVSVSMDINGRTVMSDVAMNLGDTTLNRMALGATPGTTTINPLDGYIAADIVCADAHTPAVRRRAFSLLSHLVP